MTATRVFMAVAAVVDLTCTLAFVTVDSLELRAKLVGLRCCQTLCLFA